jgi:hypothetical protein
LFWTPLSDPWYTFANALSRCLKCGGDLVAKTKSDGGRVLCFRVSEAMLAQLDALVDRLPLAKRSNLSREVMRVGLEEIARNPSRALLRPEKAVRS